MRTGGAIATTSGASAAAEGSPALIVVGFDTATGDTAVCAAHDGEPLFEAALAPSERGAPRHTEALLGEVEKAADAAGGWAAVELIAVGLGPGTFTGLRVGLATARGLGLGHGLPVRGAGSLDALARGLAGAAGGRERLAVLDARRGEVYAACYDQAGRRIWGPLVCPPEELAERIAALREPAICGGSGAVRFRGKLASRNAEIPDDADPVHRIAARHVCALAAAGRDDGSAPRSPIYLRPPDAKRWRERDSVPAAE